MLNQTLDLNYSKTCLKSHSQKEQKLGFKTDYGLMPGLMQVKSIAECYHLSLRPLSCLFLSDRFRQVLLYHKVSKHFYICMKIPCM